MNAADRRSTDHSAEAIEPVRRDVTVRCTPEQAFRVFTADMGTWWPTETHSVFREEAETCVLEPGVGGRIYERNRDGTILMWGEVTAWEPPTRLAFLWRPGRWPETPTDVDVRFEPVPEGTRVTLVHSGWERLGEAALEARAEYDADDGWGLVM